MMDETSISRTERRRNWLRKARLTLKRAAPFAAGVLATLLALFLYNTFSPKTPPLNENDVRAAIESAMASATPRPAFSSLVYNQIQPSLVLILTNGEGQDEDHDAGLGSGVVITDQGDILTSLHVVEGASEIQVTFADGTESSAEIVAEQAENDIAVLRAEQNPEILIPAVLGNPGAMQVGDETFAVGNPLGLYSSLSAGVVSGFNRAFEDEDSERELTGLIQFDAAVNPGNSGGPLLNREGQVVGIVVGIVNPTGQEVFIGIGFAVPINVAGGAIGSPPY